MTDTSAQQHAGRRLRVVFDAHAITPQRSGIGEYSWHLLRAMLASFSDRVALFLYTPSGIHPLESEEDLPRLTAGIPEGARFRFRHQYVLPRLLRGGFDLYHNPDFIVPLWSPVPVVCTVHDLIPLVHPEYLQRSLKVRLLPLYRAWLRRAVRSSARVLTVSEHSRRDIIRLLGPDPARVDVTHEAPTSEAAGGPLPADLAARLTPQRYLLFVGRADPYKGLGFLLEAFAEAVRDPALEGVLLAVAGKRDSRYDVGDRVRAFGIEDRVLLLDYVSREALSALYANAMGFVFPSLYEGFGLPPLDAMRHGTPVICSDRASLPEVTGDAVLSVDPEQVSGLARSIISLAADPVLRRNLTEKGFRRVEHFSWNQTAAKTVESYTKAANQSRS